MALTHSAPGARIACRPLAQDLRTTPTHALLKTGQIELMRVILAAGRSLPPHSVAGEITVQCIEGVLDVTVEGTSHRLQAGELLYLAGGVPHGVIALQDASALVTVALRR